MQNFTKSLKNRKAANPDLQCEGSWYFICFVSWFNGREASKLLSLNNGKWVQFRNWFLETLNKVYCKRTCCAHLCSFAVRDKVYCCTMFLVRRTILFYRGKGGGGGERGWGYRGAGRDKLHDSLRVFSHQASFMDLRTRDWVSMMRPYYNLIIMSYYRSWCYNAWHFRWSPWF